MQRGHIWDGVEVNMVMVSIYAYGLKGVAFGALYSQACGLRE